MHAFLVVPHHHVPLSQIRPTEAREQCSQDFEVHEGDHCRPTHPITLQHPIAPPPPLSPSLRVRLRASHR
jgi:hypothetical protein